MSDESISGGRELDAFLQSFSVKVEKNILRSALRAGANVFKDEAKQNAPVDEGALRSSVRVTSRAKKGTVFASVKAGGKKAPHWIWIEFGTAAHKIAPKGGGGLRINGVIVGAVEHPGAAAKPFMRPAFDGKAAAALQAVARKIRERLTAEGINVPAPGGD